MQSHESNDADVVPADPLLRRKAAAERRLEEALASIAEAQRLIDRASAGLCSVRGMAREWKRLAALYDQVKSNYYAVSCRARRLRITGRLLLDREPHAYELPAPGEESRS